MEFFADIWIYMNQLYKGLWTTCTHSFHVWNSLTNSPEHAFFCQKVGHWSCSVRGFINDYHNQGIFAPHPPLRKLAEGKGWGPCTKQPRAQERKSPRVPGDEFAYQGKRQWYKLACSPPVSHLRQLSLHTFIRFNHRWHKLEIWASALFLRMLRDNADVHILSLGYLWFYGSDWGSHKSFTHRNG